jgi:primosomal protein N' (replication factor Y)
MYIYVQPDVPKIEKPYWYSTETTKNSQEIHIGSIVRIPLHGRRVKGWVLQISESHLSEMPPVDKLKDALEFVSIGPPEHIVQFSEALSRRYLCSPVHFLRPASPPRVWRSVLPYGTKETSLQTSFKETLVLVDPRTDRRKYIAEHLADEGSTLIISPNSHKRIATWCRDVGRDAVVFTHDATKDDYIAASRSNKVIVAGRTGIFAPSTDLASIIILDDAYEQMEEERSPRWNVTDCAREFAQMFDTSLTVITSVPSVRTHGMEVRDQRETNTWPKIYIEDKKQTDPALGSFSPTIIKAIRGSLDSGTDAAIILNNTSLSQVLRCATCDHIATCENCGHSIREDADENHPFICPVCKTRRAQICLHCVSTTFKKYRRGTKGVAAEAAKLFPHNDVVEVTKANQLEYQRNKPTVFVATEALFHRVGLTKHLTSCIFLDIDAVLFRPSINAFDQTLVLINRALRAIKRSDNPFACVMVTSSPENETLRDIARHDFVSQRERELVLRKQLQLYPSRATVELTSTSEAVDSFVSKMEPDLVAGMAEHDGKKTIIIKAPNHADLAVKAYDPMRSILSQNRCAVAVDTYD